MSTFTVYTKPNCVQCTATFKALDKAGITYAKVDISVDAEARDYVMALGYLQAPVVWPAMSTGAASDPTASPKSRLQHSRSYPCSGTNTSGRRRPHDSRGDPVSGRGTRGRRCALP